MIGLRNKYFTELIKHVDMLLNRLSDKYVLYNLMLKRKVAENKSNLVSWSGQEELQYIQEFNIDIHEDVDEVVAEIENLIEQINRNINCKQRNIIEEKIAQKVEIIVSDYKKAYLIVMKELSNTNELSLELILGNIVKEVKERFSLFQFKRRYKMDRMLLWSIIGNIILAISVLVTVIIEFVKLF